MVGTRLYRNILYYLEKHLSAFIIYLFISLPTHTRSLPVDTAGDFCVGPVLAKGRSCSNFPPFPFLLSPLPPFLSLSLSPFPSLSSHVPPPRSDPLKPARSLIYNLNIEVLQIGKLIYTDFFGSKLWPPKLCGPVRPNTSNMPKAGHAFVLRPSAYRIPPNPGNATLSHIQRPTR